MEGEHRCFQIRSELSQRLQSLGFLPTTAQRIEADVIHRADDPTSLAEIESEARRLREIEGSLPGKKTKKVKSRTVERKGKNNDQA
jgi:hypothetical protein